VNFSLIPGLHFNIYALRNGYEKKFRELKSVASRQQVGEYVTRQATPPGRHFGGLKAGPDGIEFSHIPLQKGREKAVL
jgi:hypothetical protein